MMIIFRQLFLVIGVSTLENQETKVVRHNEELRSWQGWDEVREWRINMTWTRTRLWERLDQMGGAVGKEARSVEGISVLNLKEKV